MDSTISVEWLSKLQYKFERKGLKILFLLDNFSAYNVPGLVLPNVELLFLPANTTSICQPLDFGIIANVKALHKRDLLNHYWALAAGSDGNTEKLKPIGLLQALRFFKNAWDLVKEETIRRCFQKALTGIWQSEEETEKNKWFPSQILLPGKFFLLQWASKNIWRQTMNSS